MTAKHTPGPWQHRQEKLTRDGYHVAGRGPVVHDGAGGANIASVSRRSHPAGRCEEAEANARLIAAAPTLLEAARAALESMQTLAGDAGDVSEWNDGGHARETCRMLRAAIAAAEGE